MTNASKSMVGIARILWFVPAALIFLSINQFKVGLDLRSTYADGEEAIARVLEYERVDRADVTYGYVSLEVPLSDGSVITRNEMPLPYSLLHRLEGKDSLAVFVRPGAAQEIVIGLVANAQWKMAIIQSVIAFFAAVMAFVAVGAWNRYLARKGDPARVLPAEVVSP